MSDLKTYTTLEIVEKIIGHIDFYGESYYDSISLKNLDEVQELLDFYLCKLCDLVKYHTGDYRASGKALAIKARQILEYLEVYFEKVEK